MLLWLRQKTHGFFSRILLSLIALSFLFWGIGDYVGGSASQNTVVQVGDLRLSHAELSRRLEAFPEVPRQGMIEQWVQAALLDQSAELLGFEGDNRAAHLQEGVADSAFLLDSEEQLLQALWNTKRSGRYQRLALSDFKKSLRPSEAELKEFLDKHPEAYQKPASVDIQFVIIKADPMQVDNMEQWVFDHPGDLAGFIEHFGGVLESDRLWAMAGSSTPALKNGLLESKAPLLRQFFFSETETVDQDDHLIQIAEEQWAFVHRHQQYPAHKPAWAEVASRVKEDWLQQQAQTLAKEAALNLESRVQTENLGSAALSKMLPMVFKDWSALSEQPPAGVSPILYNRVFTLANPAYATHSSAPIIGLVSDDQAYYVLLLEKVEPGPPLSADQHKDFAKALKEAIAQEEVEALFRGLSEKIKVR